MISARNVRHFSILSILILAGTVSVEGFAAPKKHPQHYKKRVSHHSAQLTRANRHHPAGYASHPHKTGTLETYSAIEEYLPSGYMHPTAVRMTQKPEFAPQTVQIRTIHAHELTITASTPARHAHVAAPAPSSPHFDQVPANQTAPILERLKIVEELIRDYGRAYDYRTHTLRELRAVQTRLQAQPSVPQKEKSEAETSVPDPEALANPGHQVDLKSLPTPIDLHATQGDDTRQI